MRSMATSGDFEAYYDYYVRNHKTYSTEQEANLVQFAYHLSRNNLERSRDLFLDYAPYLAAFKKKDFLKKLAYLGVTNDQWMKFKKQVSM